MATSPDYAGVEDSIKQGYDAQRQKAAQQEGANLQGQRDALARRQAQLGGGPGGAFVKAEQQAGNESAQRGQQANASINDAQAAEMRALKQTQLGQQFATSERQGSEAHADTAQAKQFGHEDMSQQTGIQASKEQQKTGIEAAASQQQTGIQAAKEQQQVQIDANSSLQDRQIAAQNLMQERGISSQEAMQQVGITSQEDMQKTDQVFKANLAEGDRKAAAEAQAKQNTFIANSAEIAAKTQTDLVNKQENFAQTETDKQNAIKIQEFADSHQLDLDRLALDKHDSAVNEDIAYKMLNKKDIIEGFANNFSVGNLQTAFNGKNGGGMFDGSGQSVTGILGGIFGG